MSCGKIGDVADNWHKDHAPVKAGFCRCWGPFLESPGNLPSPLSIFLNVFSPITQQLQTWYLANVFIE